MDAPKFLPWFLKISLPLYILDQLTKWWVVFNLEPPRVTEGGYYIVDRFPVIDGFFWINRIHNQGMAWGLGNGSAWAPLIFPIILTVALVGILLFWKKGGFPTAVTRVAAALIISGIIGNFTDRLLQGFFLPEFKEASFFTRFTEGYVVDFLDFHLPVIDYHYPSFNIADSCICVSAVLLVWSSFFSKEYLEKMK